MQPCSFLYNMKSALGHCGPPDHPEMLPSLFSDFTMKSMHSYEGWRATDWGRVERVAANAFHVNKGCLGRRLAPPEHIKRRFVRVCESAEEAVTMAVAARTAVPGAVTTPVYPMFSVENFAFPINM